jgi:hypothetical protein
MPSYPPRPPIPEVPNDPFTDSSGYLQARLAQWQDAHRELTEAWLFVAAEILRDRWPTAHRVVFDRTERNHRPLRRMQFVRIEDQVGATLAAPNDLPTSEEQDEYGVLMGLEHLRRAEQYLQIAGLVGPGRCWDIDSEYGSQGQLTSPYLCRITLPPATRPAGEDRATAQPDRT